MTRQLIDEANAILKPYGVTIGSPGHWERDLAQVLQTGGAPNLETVVKLAKQLEQELSKMHDRQHRQRQDGGGVMDA